MKHTIVSVLCSVLPLAYGQTQIDLSKQSRRPDFSASGATKPVQVGFALPSTCTLGQMFFNTSVNAGTNLYGCTATNTWSVLSVIPTGISRAGIDIGDGTTAGVIKLFPPNEPNNFVAWQAPATNTTPATYILPAWPPTAGQVLSCAAPIANAASCSWSNGPPRTVTNSVWYPAALKIGSVSQCAAVVSNACSSGGPVADGAVLRVGQNDYVQFQVTVPASWNGNLDIAVLHKLQANVSGTGTLQLNYATACVHPATTSLATGLVLNTAISVTPNYAGGDSSIGKLDSVSPETGSCLAGDIMYVRVSRPSFGTATDAILILGMQISLPYTI